METLYVFNSENSGQEFNQEKVTQAITRAMDISNQKDDQEAHNISKEIWKSVGEVFINESIEIDVLNEHIKNYLRSNNYNELSKSFILESEKNSDESDRSYNQKHEINKDIFSKRIFLKPYEYPELLEFVDAIRHSYWIHTEFNFTADVQDFNSISQVERDIIKRTMLAISQIEVSVKTFWGQIYEKMPKPEIGSVGATFSESEVRHHDAYSHLLEILGLNDEFEQLKNEPEIMNRIKYLEDSTKFSKSDDNKEYTQSVLLFSLFIEHVSLFSQFLIMMSFNKYKNMFKGTSNVVEATSKEEQIHGNFGTSLINIIKEENPSWFDESFNEEIKKACINAFESEKELIDWIFKSGELDFLPKNVVVEFIKNRFNVSMQNIGLEKIFEVDESLLEQTDWFDDEIIGTKHVDFFQKRSINYSKRAKSFSEDSLF